VGGSGYRSVVKKQEHNRPVQKQEHNRPAQRGYTSHAGHRTEAGTQQACTGGLYISHRTPYRSRNTTGLHRGAIHLTQDTVQRAGTQQACTESRNTTGLYREQEHNRPVQRAGTQQACTEGLYISRRTPYRSRNTTGLHREQEHNRPHLCAVCLDSCRWFLFLPCVGVAVSHVEAGYSTSTVAPASREEPQ
jgi:hypothetical protein